jgi:small-conductance mechanosensitive channel
MRGSIARCQARCARPGARAAGDSVRALAGAGGGARARAQAGAFAGVAAVTFALVALAAGAAPAMAAGLPAALKLAPPPAASAPASAAVSGGDSLAALIGALEARDRLRAEADEAMRRAEELARVEADIVAAEKQFAALAQQASSERLSTSGRQQLMDVDGTLRVASLRVDGVVEQLHDGTLGLEKVLDHLRAESARWRDSADLASEDARELRDRIRLVQEELGQQADRVRQQRDRLLGLLDRAIQLRSRMTALHNDLVLRRERIAESLRTVEQEPIWELFGATKWDTDTLRAERRLRWNSVAAYLRGTALWLLLVGAAILAGSAWLLRRTPALLVAEPPLERVAVVHTREVLAHPHWAAVLLALMAIAFAAPTGGPVAFYDLGWLLVPVPAAFLALRVLGVGMRKLVWALVIAVLLLPLRTLAELDPLIDRLKTLLQLGLLIAALSWELARGYLPQTFPLRLRAGLRWCGWALLALLVVAAWATLVGYVGLGRTLRNGILGSLGGALVLLALYHALHGAGLGLLRTPLAHLSWIVRRRRAMLDRVLEKVLRVIAVTCVALVVVSSFGFGERLPLLFDEARAADVRVGEASVSIGALLAAAAILVGTWLAVVALRLLLEDELLPRFALKPGVPFAVSALTRYTVAVAGFLFALAAAGLDLTKVTLLAGAIGVGVGLGLQNIVNNFISGLILLVERPIHVGDSVETATANGVVQRIGIRASVLRTGQGADVIVPNGDLLARQVTNWTAWDRQRRVDIDLRVPFGTEPPWLVELLERLAAGHAQVRREPAPQALFMGFGDVGLDFRLMAWVLDPDTASVVTSELRTRILEAFAAAGVALPLPQREVWLRRAGAPAPTPRADAPGPASGEEAAPDG